MKQCCAVFFVGGHTDYVGPCSIVLYGAARLGCFHAVSLSSDSNALLLHLETDVDGVFRKARLKHDWCE